MDEYGDSYMSHKSLERVPRCCAHKYRPECEVHWGSSIRQFLQVLTCKDTKTKGWTVHYIYCFQFKPPLPL